MKKIRSLSAGILVVALLAGCKRDDQIKTYDVPKDSSASAPTPTVPAQPDPNAMMGAGAPSVPFNSAPVHWTVPAGWKENPPSGIRLGDLDVQGANGKMAKLTVTSFQGDVGGEAANVSRWRREVGLADVPDSQITSEKTKVDSSDGKIYDFSGPAERTTVAWVMRDNVSWFFKLRGDPDTVAGAKSAFLDFLKSIHFGEAGTTTVAANPAANPHAGMDMGGMNPGMNSLPAPNPGALPKWTVPANWTETQPGMMVTKSFAITGDGGQKAAVTISVLGGTGGGTLNNVNRWRHQLQLPEVTDDTLAQNTKSLDVLGGKATLVDFNGTDASGQPSRMVAAAMTSGDQTWFYKMTGPSDLVGREKDGFIKFVQEIHYP